MGRLKDMLGFGEPKIYDAPCVMGDESIMNEKNHGTSETPVQTNLRWNCDPVIADKICNFNRLFAERRGSFQTNTTFLEEAKTEYDEKGEIEFYDSNNYYHFTSLVYIQCVHIGCKLL